MAWMIDYNGVGSTTGEWSHITIKEAKEEAQYAEDGTTHEATRHSLTGSAMITAATDKLFVTLVENIRTALARPGKDLLIQNNVGDADNELVNIEAVPAGDAAYPKADGGVHYLGYPKCDFEIAEIHGHITAVVEFTFEWYDYETVVGDGDTAYHVMSHWWTQEWVIEHGLTQRTVRGVLRVRPDAPVAAADEFGPKSGPNPDRYRRLVAPTLPPGHRVDKMSFATDETGCKLMYTFEDHEYPRNLPAPAQKGEGSFRWRRGLVGGPVLGLKVFDAELEGDKNASPAEMLAQLMRCAMNRITLTGTTADQILEIEVTEGDIFNANRVGLRLVARGVGNKKNPMDLTPGFQLLQDITEGTTVYEPPGAWGAGLVRSVRRAMFRPASGYEDSDFPYAAYESTPEPGDTHAVYQLPDSSFTQWDTSVFEVGPEATHITSEHEDYPYLMANYTEHVTNDTGMITLPSHSLNSPDIPYQVRRPRVRIISEFTVSRQGAPPERVHLKPPPGAVLVREEFHVSAGALDANNNRTFNAHYLRVLDYLVQGQEHWQTEEVQIPVVGSVSLVVFRPSSEKLAFPFDPKTQLASAARERDLLTPSTTFDFNFLITPESYYSSVQA